MPGKEAKLWIGTTSHTGGNDGEGGQIAVCRLEHVWPVGRPKSKSTN